MKIKLILFFVVFSALACNKNEVEGMRIEGRVKDSRHGAGVSNASVLVEEQIVEGGALNGAFQFATEVSTDGNGNFQADFDRNNALIYKVDFTKQGYFSLTRELNPDDLSPGEAYTLNTTLTPEAFIQVNLYNAFPETENDFFRFRFMNANFDCECCGNGWTELTGLTADSTKTCRMHGDYMLYYTYEIDKAKEVVVVDSVYCPAFQTTTLNIAY